MSLRVAPLPRGPGCSVHVTSSGVGIFCFDLHGRSLLSFPPFSCALQVAGGLFLLAMKGKHFGHHFCCSLGVGLHT